MRDDKNNEVEVFINDALHVPSAPMSLLCPQQIAQQTQRDGDGFHAIAPHGLLTVDGFTKTIQYDARCRLPIFYTLEGTEQLASCLGMVDLPAYPAVTDNLTSVQRLV